MAKSEFKVLLSQMSAESIETSEECPSEFPVVIDDIIVKLTTLVQSLKYDMKEITIDDIVSRIYLPIITACKHIPVYITVMDKYSLVTRAKQAEQQSRDLQNLKEEAKCDMQQRSICEDGLRHLKQMMSSETPIADSKITLQGCAWHRSFTSDRVFKRFVVRLFTERAIFKLPSMMSALGVPAHHRLILDGEIRNAVCVVAVLHTGAHTPKDMELEVELQNTLGEFDVAHVHHLECQTLQQFVTQVPGGSFLIGTVDTDILLINAQRSTDFNYPNEVRVMMGMPKTSKVSGVPAEPGRLYYFNPHSIRKWGDSILADTRCGFDGLVHVFHLAGSDFNHDGIPGVGNMTVVKGYLNWMIQFPHRTAGDFYKYALSEQHSKLKGVKSASQRTINLKRKCAHLEETTIHPIRRASWATDDYWSGRNQMDPVGQGYVMCKKQKRVCFAEDILRDRAEASHSM